LKYDDPPTAQSAKSTTELNSRPRSSGGDGLARPARWIVVVHFGSRLHIAARATFYEQVHLADFVVKRPADDSSDFLTGSAAAPA